ncbi:hypothetical protein ScPMuIL_018642 [Solemya velum]
MDIIADMRVWTYDRGEVSHVNELVPATSIWTTSITDPVKLRLIDSVDGRRKPTTVHSLFRSVVRKVPHQLAMAVKRGGEWTEWTYEEYYGDLRRVAKGFIRLGLEPYAGVCILGFNSPEWFLANFGAIFAGGIAIGLYNTNSTSLCEYIINHAKSNVVVVEDNFQLQKILSIRQNLRYLKAIIQYTGELEEKQDNLYTWNEFMALHEGVPDSLVEERLKVQAPNKCCTLLYTSGTTGTPKGVMLSHDNVTWTAFMICQTLGFLDKEDGRVVSYLPLSHIAGQMLDMYIPICCHMSVYFAQPDAMKGTLFKTLVEAKPTIFLGVPRIWEKIKQNLEMKEKENSFIKKTVLDLAKSIGLEASNKKSKGDHPPLMWSLANMFVFKNIRAALGFDQVHTFLTGAAPVSVATLKFFHSLGIPIITVYGSTESTGPQTSETQEQFKIGSIGTSIDGVETKLEEGSGEILGIGRHIFMGYLNSEEKTREVIDDNGWYHSGDVGKVDEEGKLYVTGRIKEIIITEGGENIAPVPMEEAVKTKLPVVNNCMLVGDTRKFVCLLICLRTDVDPENAMPKDELSADVLQWCKSLDCTSTKVSELIRNKNENVQRAIQIGIDQANQMAPSRVAQIKKWRILPVDFSIPGGEIGPTLKLKRSFVLQKYEKLIDDIYEENT